MKPLNIIYIASKKETLAHFIKNLKKNTYSKTEILACFITKSKKYFIFYQQKF